MQKLLIFIGLLFLILNGCQLNPEVSENIAEPIEDATADKNNESKPRDLGMLEYQDTVVGRFISMVKNNDKKTIAENTRFPLSREYPLPDLNDASDLIEQYDMIFDSGLVDDIVTSDPKEDWAKVGWRGIMFKNGKIWLDVDGVLISINYQSALEEKKRKELIKKDKSNLHKSLLEFDNPIALMETEKFRIRIDQEGDYYRYASWGIEKNQSDEPDLIIYDGEVVMDGSGGNHYYLFKNGNYTYKCYVIVLGESESPLGWLKINQKIDKANSNKVILNDDIIYIER